MSVRLKRLEALADTLPPVGDTLFAQYHSMRSERRQAAWLRTLTDQQLKDLLRQEIEHWSVSEVEKAALLEWVFNGNPAEVAAIVRESLVRH